MSVFRDIPEIERARIKKWLDHRLAPPKPAAEMSNDEIADILQLFVEEGAINDGKTIWLCEAMCRLRSPQQT